MMRKKIVSLCMALVLCLSLLPVTALAADGIELYVGGQRITESGCYANQGGTWTKVDGTEPANGQFSYDAATATLTLNQAKIVNYQDVTVGGGVTYPGSVIAFSQSADVSLTIVVSQGTSNITGTGGIRVVSKAGDASLSISGPGSLEVNVDRNDSGISLIGSKNVNLNIDSADVKTLAAYYYGVDLHAGDGFKAAAVVNNGKLTAGGSGGIGIYYRWTNPSDSGTSSLTVSGNAVVDTRDSKILIASQASEVQVSAGSDGNGGIVFDGKSGTVYGDVTLQEDLEIGTDETLTIGKDASLTVPGGKTLTNDGTVTTEEGGTLTGNITNAPPKITTEGLSEGTVNTEYNQTLAADNTPTSWSVTNGTLPNELTLENGTISGTPTAAGTYSFTVTATNDYGSDSKEFTLTIDQQGTIHVTSVSLDKTSLELTEGGTGTLIATVEPNNATNKNVTWSTSNASIATVNNGEVTAVSAGTATITVTTADGNHTATCTVTVKHGNMVHTPKKDATCTEAGHTAYWYCSGCQKYFKDEAGTEGTTLADTVIPAAGHTFRGGWCAVCGARDPSYVPPANPNYRIDVTTTEGGTVDKDPAAAKAGETVTLTPTPDAGYEVGEVTVTDRFGNAVAVTENADGTYTFTMPSGQVRVEVTFVEATPESLPFTDVNEGDWFHDAVRYVYDNGLMDGVGDGQFAPNATTNRAMVVTILHRLAGEPAVVGDVGFTDVEPGLWYTDAVLWAAQKGIVNGISETEFSPSGDLTREQLATVLYRYAESMGYDVSASVDLSGFPDAGDIQSYATQALSWAVAEGLLQGFEDDSLQPGGTATRAQIATILMRFLAAAPTA